MALARAVRIAIAAVRRLRAAVDGPSALAGARTTAGAAVVLLAAGAIGLAREVGWARVRVVNVSGRTLTLSVDGRPEARVEPVSTEVPNAGVTLRVRAGRRRLVAVAAAPEGGIEVAGDEDADLDLGAGYLWAPARGATCFSIHRDAYGSADVEGPAVEDLDRTAHLWRLPDEVDAWFHANLVPARDPAFSGGVRVAVRQEACAKPPGR